MTGKLSKFKKLKKKTAQAPAENKPKTSASRKLTTEESAAIIRDRLANRPVIIWRYRNGKWNLKFIITLAIMLVAMVAAIYFFSMNY